MEDFIKNTPGNGRFLFSAFKNFTNQDIINFLKDEGLEVKEERGNRIFPVTDKSKGARGTTAFLVEKGTEGFSFGRKENKTTK